jgi:hypothetical protein
MHHLNVNSNGDAEGGLEERMLGGGYEGFDQLMASVRRKQHRKRRLQSATFSIATNPVTGRFRYTPQAIFVNFLHVNYFIYYIYMSGTVQRKNTYFIPNFDAFSNGFT